MLQVMIQQIQQFHRGLPRPSVMHTITTLPTSCFTFIVLRPTRALSVRPWARGDPPAVEKKAMNIDIDMHHTKKHQFHRSIYVPPHGIASSLFLVSAIDLVGGTITSALLP